MWFFKIQVKLHNNNGFLKYSTNFFPLLIHLLLDLYPKLYPELSQYMGLSLNEEEIRANMALVPGAPSQGVCIM